MYSSFVAEFPGLNQSLLNFMEVMYWAKIHLLFPSTCSCQTEVSWCKGVTNAFFL